MRSFRANDGWTEGRRMVPRSYDRPSVEAVAAPSGNGSQAVEVPAGSVVHVHVNCGDSSASAVAGGGGGFGPYGGGFGPYGGGFGPYGSWPPGVVPYGGACGGLVPTLPGLWPLPPLSIGGFPLLAPNGVYGGPNLRSSCQDPT